MAAKSDRPDAKLIYDALTNLGRKKRQLSPQMIEAYDELLYCPAVQARTRGAAELSRMERAVIAERLIREAIDSLPPGRDQQVACALLCAEAEYVGKTVAERLVVMEARFGFDWSNVYDERRSPVLQDIVAFLLRSISAPQEARSIFGAVEFGLSGSETRAPKDALGLAEVTAELRYSCLGALFAEHFDEELAEQLPRFTQDQAALFRRQRVQVLEVCSEHCFEAVAHVGRFVATPPSRVLFSRLEREANASLQALLDAIRTTGPGFTEAEWRLLAEYGTRLDNSDTTLVHAARDMYESRWREWQKRPSTAAEAHDSLRALASVAGAIFMLCRPHVDLRLVASRARGLAHKTLAYYYDFDTDNPSLRGGSLRSLADRYMNEADAIDGIAI